MGGIGTLGFTIGLRKSEIGFFTATSLGSLPISGAARSGEEPNWAGPYLKKGVEQLSVMIRRT